jgi:hypothetical protein
MVAVLIMLTPGYRNVFIHCQKAKVRITILPIMDLKTQWNSTLELHEHASLLRNVTHKWLQNPKYSDYRPLFTTQEQWTIVQYVMDVLRLIRNWTLWMSKRHTVRSDHVIAVYNNMFDHIDSMMRDLAKKKTQCKEDLVFAVKLP